MTAPLLRIKNLSKTYSNGVKALKGISFDVQKGEFLVVIGLSGSGKSTLLRCLNRLHEPTSGEIFFNGKSYSEIHGSEIHQLRKKIAMIFQHFNLIPRHTVLSNVLMGRLGSMSSLRSIFGLYDATELKKAFDFLRLVGIEDKAYDRVDQLSGGQQQRVAIARALMQEPDILLADEPVSSLDPATCHTVLDYLKKVNRELGITIVCNLHFLSLVRQYAGRVLALQDGQTVYDGDPGKIDEFWFEKIYGPQSKEVSIK